jgi:hypothetical protein
VKSKFDLFNYENANCTFSSFALHIYLVHVKVNYWVQVFKDVASRPFNCETPLRSTSPRLPQSKVHQAKTLAADKAARAARESIAHFLFGRRAQEARVIWLK